jgi:pyruvate dehydrogenase E2 component (dihydrolipoamide acetyltransferase)
LATNIVMPQMGYDMREGTVVRWHKAEGDTVTRGEVIAEIETDKATVEFEAYTSGVLRKIIAQEGVAIPVGDLIAVVAGPDEVLPDDVVLAGAAGTPEPAGAEAATESPSGREKTGLTSPAAASKGQVRASPIARRIAQERGIDLTLVSGSGPGGRIVEKDVLDFPSVQPLVEGQVRASPIARRLARERGIDLTRISGSGPGGRVVEKDVLEFAAAKAPAEPPPVEADPVSTPSTTESGRVDLSRMRQVIAKVTADSKRDAPHFYLTAEVDMGKAMSLRRFVNDAAAEGNRISVNDLVIKACALALGQHPKFNGSFQGEQLQFNPGINIGIAIALEAGLIVPGIPDCQSKNLHEIAADSKDLIARANQGTLRNEEYSGTTFSISNLGMFDVDSFAAIIFPPHAAVLAVGAVKEQPVVRDGELAVGQVMKATLSTDHRVADGAEAARFLVAVKQLLEDPTSLVS